LSSRAAKLVFSLAASYLQRGGTKDCHSWQWSGVNRLNSWENLDAESWQFGCHILQCALPFGVFSGR
jgi:hypothetical protein